MLPEQITVKAADGSTDLVFAKCWFDKDQTIYKNANDDAMEIKIARTVTKRNQSRILLRVSTEELETLLDGTQVPVQCSTQVVLADYPSHDPLIIGENIAVARNLFDVTGLIDKIRRGEK